ncbi:MAG: HipA N-terminal domain-containing protein [Bacteroides sp.]
MFEDSLPDGYGRFLLNRLLKKQGIDEEELTPLQRLSIVGSAGMGALCYEPATTIGARTHRRNCKVHQAYTFRSLQGICLIRGFIFRIAPQKEGL